ncbi:BZ3500_MvSof-1268-A1-R1_Chr1-1g01036 [Microbotryum saponariae]|uniref:BZ3500_MvSof-1268-A1-R1_Chr1-1g01036 protein n=1 Tax=Microbotryum saponariae TaxID=289078 RepID=A0A2X0KIN1_9BASI|nr:BZ3500_MvSof-1268-A1-R1_Chr1-1g01036 [Microbotryum saponariae]SCZ93249.1 BZ3501_MvSof-1269-A2-R1_Chr1-1g00633 [Microbotryum saponariae]
MASSSTPNPKARNFATGPPASSKGIDFYSVDTPNGMKISLAFAELKEAGSDLVVNRHNINFGKNEQKEEWFLKEVNPNGRIPAVFESGSILLYIAKVSRVEKTCKTLPPTSDTDRCYMTLQHYDSTYNLHFQDDKDETDMISWIFFQNTGLGPMQGQANHFLSAAPEKIPYAARRFIDETKRLLSVYEEKLVGREYVVGEGQGKYSYADITAFTWIRAVPLVLGASLSESGFPNVEKWVARIADRPASKASFKPDDFVTKALSGGPEALKKRVEWVYEQKEEHKKDEL